MAKTRLSMDLPKVGDRLKRVMTGNNYNPDVVYTPEDCMVTYVNESHGWYEVIFPQSNIRECYGLPSFDHSVVRGVGRGEMPVACIETGVVYSSLHECAKDMGFTHGEVSRQVIGKHAHCHGYHFTTVL